MKPKHNNTYQYCHYLPYSSQIVSPHGDKYIPLTHRMILSKNLPLSGERHPPFHKNLLQTNLAGLQCFVLIFPSDCCHVENYSEFQGV